MSFTKRKNGLPELRVDSTHAIASSCVFGAQG
jgi:hypothetical protein